MGPYIASLCMYPKYRLEADKEGVGGRSMVIVKEIVIL